MPQEDAKLVANALRDCLKQTSELQELILNSKVLMNFLLKLLPDASLETLLWLGTHCPSKHVIDALILALSSQYEKISKSLRSQLNLMLLHFFIIEKDWFDQNDFVKPELNSKSIQKLLSTDTFAKSGLEVINASNFSEFFNILLRFLNHSEKYFREKSIQLALLFSNEQQLDLVMLKVFSLADEEYSKYSKEFHSRFPSHDIFSFCSQGVQSPSSQVVIRCLTCLRSKMASTPKDYQSLLMFILPCFLNKDQKVRKAAKETLNQLLQALTHFDFESTPGNKWPAPFSPIGYSIDKIKFVKPTLLVKWLEHVLMIDLEASPANVCHFPFSKKFDTVLVAFLSHLIKLSLHLQHTWLVLLQPQCLSLTIITLHKHYRRLFSQLGSTPNRDSIDVILSFLKCIHPSMAHDIFKTPGVFDTLKLFLANYSVAEFEEVQLCTLKLIQTGFWVALSTDHQYELFNLLLTIVSKSKSSENVLEAKAALNRVPLAEALVGRFLTTFITLKQSQEEELTLEPSKKKPKLFVRSKHMSKLIALLELLKYKPYANYHVLVHPLFQALDLVLRLKPGTGSAQAHSIQHEFITQLILSDLLLAEMSTLNETVFRVELLVECLRSSDNPQTRNSALLVLSKIAPLCPDKVLLNIMPIFTFMGLHVSKQDDEFSFNTIESTIQSIVPSLSLDVVHVQQVIQVFVDTVMHIPVHRRLRLFATLVKTLGIEQLFMVILLLLEKNVHELFEFALLISSEFSEPMQLRAMIKLITFICISIT
ncbi:HEAT repeat-containing protein 1 [Coelomomyces lativittatus]|nr:HEAT repeat-containing protein 1 [Coelomomyces lativittatus]